ncbi:MAG: SipW-dependent-type signal peptide-containing protein [Clostridia bacterium]|nr:SipW-dependent-type signal peptide-containing protein [Clostridia bacterium]
MKKTRTSLLLSALALILSISMLVGSTFAWFTDSVTSAGNKIQAGTLKLDLEVYDAKTDTWSSIKESKAALFNYDKWEPGYVDVTLLKIENEGTLALKWIAKFISAEALSELAKVIDVYVLPSETELSFPADRDLDGYTKVGTVADFVNTIEETTNGTLLPNTCAYLGIALKMRENAGNEYQGLSLGTFDIQILATQFTYEKDSFDEKYDKDASLDYITVSNLNELKIALAAKEESIVLTKDIAVGEALSVNVDTVIRGAGFAITRASGFNGAMLTVKNGSALSLEDVAVDGGAVWGGGAPTPTSANSGLTASGALIQAENNAKITLGKGAVLQNNDGANAVNLGTRIGATLTLNGGEIIGNRSGAGAVWGGGHITINSGKINANASTGVAGAIRMVGKCNLTMNGGEICGNVAATDGGAIWGYGINGNSSVYTLNSGKISGNTAGGVGGGIYTGTYSTIELGGDFEICDNTAADSGAMRLTNYTTFRMNGGKISGNVSTNNASYNGFYGWCPILTLSGGALEDAIYLAGGHTPTVGGGEGNGTIYFNIGTSHNTVNLVKDFKAFRFVANEGASNFGSFNFRPAAGYTYTAGDEAKLICLNAGYETYWDSAAGLFRLKAV